MAEKEQLTRVQEVAARLAVSVRELWRLVAEGVIPKPIKLGPKTTRWPETEINEFLERRKRER